MDRYEHVQEDMQLKYRTMKQLPGEKVKKYAERLDAVLRRIERPRRDNPMNELLSFREGLRSENKIKLLLRTETRSPHQPTGAYSSRD